MTGNQRYTHGSARLRGCQALIAAPAASFMLAVALLLPAAPALAQQQDIASAEASFTYLATTLQSYRRSGRLADNPGIDGAELEIFIDLLEKYYLRFSDSFNADSAMCRFYRDPENGRMTIEERAEISFSFLPGLAERVQQYLATDREFQDEVEYEFGRILLDNINRDKLEAVSNLKLPARQFDEAAVISFLDSSCT